MKLLIFVQGNILEETLVASIARIEEQTFLKHSKAINDYGDSSI